MCVFIYLCDPVHAIAHVWWSEYNLFFLFTTWELLLPMEPSRCPTPTNRQLPDLKSAPQEGKLLFASLPSTLITVNTL